MIIRNLLQSNMVIRNFLVALKLFLNAKSSLSLWSRWQIDHGKWFLNTNLFLIKQFLNAKFDCTQKTQDCMTTRNRQFADRVTKDLHHITKYIIAYLNRKVQSHIFKRHWSDKFWVDFCFKSRVINIDWFYKLGLKRLLNSY